MAAVQFAKGLPITVKPSPKEIMWYLLAKEFGWTIPQIKKTLRKDIIGILKVMNTVNEIQNAENKV